MSTLSEETLVINRGMSLHKMIRMITFALGGEVIEYCDAGSLLID